MDNKTHEQLERAQHLFYSWKLTDAYHILRRYFDRIPFKVDAEHAEHIGMFIRILLELGKDGELQFYLDKLEVQWERLKLPAVAYQLALIYIHQSSPKLDRAKILLQNLIRDEKAFALHPKAKMSLAHVYARTGERGACRPLIYSIPEQKNVRLVRLHEVWKANVLSHEEKYDEALKTLEKLRATFTQEEDWYAYYSLRSIQAHIFLLQKKYTETENILAELKKIFKTRQFKTVQTHLNVLDNAIQKSHQTSSEVILIKENDNYSLKCRQNSLILNMKKTAEKLLCLLAKQKKLSKQEIMKALFKKNYEAPGDDKKIYTQIHSARKRLQKLGLEGESIVNEETGYRFIPQVKLVNVEG